VRELINAIECAVVSADGLYIEADDFPKRILTRHFIQKSETSNSDTENQACLKSEKSNLEKSSIIRALEKSSGNKSNAIKQLGMSRSQFYKKLAQYGLK
jgi:DNA-binding NtrC family response regulator